METQNDLIKGLNPRRDYSLICSPTIHQVTQMFAVHDVRLQVTADEYMDIDEVDAIEMVEDVAESGNTELLAYVYDTHVDFAISKKL